MSKVRGAASLACITALLMVGGSVAPPGTRIQAAGTQSPAPASSMPPSPRAVLDTFCVTCHNARLRTADLQLDAVDVEHPAANAVTWEKVLRKLRARDMPPPGMPHPDTATYESLARYLETALDQAAAATPNPGRPAAYRLSRFQYANAVRDLIALDVDAESLLPADDSGYGFDNIGDVREVSRCSRKDQPPRSR